MNDVIRSPDGLPTLRPGIHLAPEDGACLMEYVSLLAGTTFSDHPRCTEPVLAALARLVNDASSDAGRPLLAGFAPALVAAAPSDAATAAALVSAVVRRAHAVAPRSAVLGRVLRRAQRRQRRLAAAGLRAALARRFDPLHRRAAAQRWLQAAVAALRAAPGPDRDALLRDLLAVGIAEAAVRQRGARAGTVPARTPRDLNAGRTGPAS